MTTEEKEFLNEVLGVFRTIASIEHNIFSPIAKEYAERASAILFMDDIKPKTKAQKSDGATVVTTNPMESITAPVMRKEGYDNAYTTC